MDMNYLLRKLDLRVLRYCVLITFLVCNALVASIAVWNLGLARGLESSRSSLLGIDAYLTFLGCSGLLLLFVVGFVELARKCWSIATVWFECVWISLWGLMYNVAGIALTVIASQEDCSATDRSPKCVSAQVLLAFTWLCAMALTIYFSTLIFAVFTNKKKDPTIWYSMMRKFPWAGTCTILASMPPTPTLPRLQNTVPIIHAPKPKHARQNGAMRASIFSWRSGLSHEYQIEHYQPPAIVQPEASRAADLPRAAAPPILRAPVLTPVETGLSENTFTSSLYPMYMQQAIVNANSEPTRPEPALTDATMSAASLVVQTPIQATLPPPPPPLGDWPRPDIISQPVTKTKRKMPPIPCDNPSGENGVSHSPSGSRQRERDANPSRAGQSTAPSSFAPARPIGPRRRSGSSDMTRPPALDLRRVEYT